MNSALSAGTSSLGKMELVGQTGTQAPQSMQPLGSTYNWVAASNFSSSFLGWMQSVGQASTQSSSLVQVTVIVYAMIAVLLVLVWPATLTGSSLGGPSANFTVQSPRTRGR